MIFPFLPFMRLLSRSQPLSTLIEHLVPSDSLYHSSPPPVALEANPYSRISSYGNDHSYRFLVNVVHDNRPHDVPGMILILMYLSCLGFFLTRSISIFQRVCRMGDPPGRDGSTISSIRLKLGKRHQV